MPQLDALRALAVGAVIVHHFLPLERFLPHNFISFGELGVRLFFVLSGFLITGILLKCRADFGLSNELRSFKLRQFYARRFLRIFPVFEGPINTLKRYFQYGKSKHHADERLSGSVEIALDFS